jgi:hypothetical protein
MRRTLTLVSVMALTVSMLAVLPAGADHIGPLVEPTLFAGNDSCDEYRIDPPTAGTYEFDVDGVAFVVSIETDGTYFSFSSNVPVQQVAAKGGPNYNLYDYYAAGLFDVTHDNGLHSPINPQNGQPYGLSHISFCFDEPIVPEGTLSVAKDAAGSYDRTVTWELEKSVDPASHTGVAGELAGSSSWSVIATKSEELSNFEVTGEITIGWEGEFDVTVDVYDVLDDGTEAVVDCGDGTSQVTLSGPSGSATCDYTAAPDDAEADVNRVELSLVSEPEGRVAGELYAEADIVWTEHLIGFDEGTLADPRFGYSELISSSTTETFPEDFDCPGDANLYEDGEYTYTKQNIATLNGNINLEASAQVDVTCTLPALEVSKTADGSYNRTVEWELDKSVNPDFHSGGPGDIFSSIWTVEATKSVTFGDYKVEGEITITNPAAIDQTITAITDVLDDSTEATVTCPMYTVEAGGNVVCTYVAYPIDAGAALNTATVSAAGNADVIATAPVEFTENLIGYDEGTLIDERFDYSEPISSSTTVTFDDDFACPAGDSGLYVDGFYSFTETNVATLNGNIGLTADATVTVECRRVFQDETVTGAGLNWSDVGKGKTSTNNWFQYTVGTEGTFDLVSGRQLEIVGDVTITPLGDGTTELAFAFDPPWQLADVSGNVKIEPLDAQPKVYLEPGNFSHHFTEPDDLDDESPTEFSVIVPTASYGYAIHLDAGYWTS